MRVLYFFDLAGAARDFDKEGIELDSISDARVLAAEFTGELLRDCPEVVLLGDEVRMEVTDSAGLLLFTVHVVVADAPGGPKLN